MNRKQLLNEIEQWRVEGLIDDDCAATLKNRYPKGSKRTLSTVFSIVGCVLVSAGIVLIFTTNWYRIPFTLKAILSFVPLIAGQTAVMFTAIKRRDNTAWREGSTIFAAGTLFASYALIQNVFNIPNSYQLYILICGIAILPLVYILDAALPLIISYASFLSWGMMYDTAKHHALIMTLLSAACCVYPIIHHKRTTLLQKYSAWVCTVGAGTTVAITGLHMETEVFCLLFAYCLIIFALSRPDNDNSMPFRPLGAISVAAMIAISTVLSYDPGYDRDISVAYIIITAAAIAAALIIAFIKRRRDIYGLIFICCGAASAAFSLIMRAIGKPCALITAILIAGLTAGISLIVRGVKEQELSTTNLGLVLMCALILLALYGIESIGILAKGIILLVLGAAILVYNIIVLKRGSKSRSKEEAAVSQ